MIMMRHRKGIDCRKCGKELDEETKDPHHRGICRECRKEDARLQERERYARNARIRDVKKTFVSLFSGAGGLDQGFIAVGWNPIFMTDVWKPAIDTLKKNHPNVKVERLDIKDIDKDYMEKIIQDSGTTEVTAVIGGPPCQSFSRLNQNKLFNEGVNIEENLNDPRRSLFMDFLRVASYVKPVFIIMENVADLQTRKLGGSTDRKDDKIINIIYEEFDKIGYVVKSQVMRVDEYGIPQKRKRIIFIGIRKDKNINPTFPEKIKLETTVKDEFSKIFCNHPNQEEKPHNKEWEEMVGHIPSGGYYNDLPIEFKKLKKVTMEDAVNYSGQFKEYCFKKDNVYKQFKVLDNKKILFEEKNYSQEEFLSIINGEVIYKVMPRMGTYLRRINENISHTITRNPLIHPTKDREITVREKAIIQTFPPDYTFVGKISDQHILVGNAVPCNLGKRIAEHLEKILRKDT